MLAAALALAGCRTTGSVPRPFPGAAVVTKTPAPPESDATGDVDAARPVAPDRTPSPAVAPEFGSAIAQFALGFRGVPYRLGGADPDGFDCSGLVQYVFAQYGIAVPRIVEEQYEVGKKVKPSDLEPGDLIFFNTKSRGRGVSHVAIAVGNVSFVHAPNSTGVVRVETLDQSYWGARIVGIRRINASSTSN
jgi:cell wall-associated NlpC family hydrolase